MEDFILYFLFQFLISPLGGDGGYSNNNPEAVLITNNSVPEYKVSLHIQRFYAASSQSLYYTLSF